MLYLQIDFGFLGSVFSGAVGALISLLRNIFVFLFNLLVAITHFIWSALVFTVQFILRMLGHVGRFFRNLWEGVIKKGLLKLLQAYTRLVEKLNRFLAPVMKWIEKIRALIDKWYFKLFGPILNMIQTLRKILTIFRIFGLKFARKLDERLFRLERKILEPYLQLRKAINEVITFLALSFDPNGLFSRVPLLKSIGQIFGLLASLTSGRSNRTLNPDEEASQKADRERYTLSNIEARAAARTKAGLTDEDKALSASVRKELLEVTGLKPADLPPAP